MSGEPIHHSSTSDRDGDGDGDGGDGEQSQGDGGDGEQPPWTHYVPFELSYENGAWHATRAENDHNLVGRGRTAPAAIAHYAQLMEMSSSWTPTTEDDRTRYLNRLADQIRALSERTGEDTDTLISEIVSHLDDRQSTAAKPESLQE
jgi:hypothetical protein